MRKRLNFHSSFSRIIMIKQLVLILLCYVSLQINASEYSHHQQINNLIAEANSVLLTDRTRFNNIIVQLKAESTLTTEQSFEVQFLLAYQQSYAGNFKNSEKILDKLINEPRFVNIKKKFEANKLMLLNMAATKNWLKGFSQVEVLLSTIDQIEDVSIKQNALIAIITFFSQLEQHDLALYHLEQLNKLELTKHNQCISNQLSLKAKKELSKLAIAVLEIDAALASCNNKKSLIFANIIRSYQAELFIENKEPKNAISLLIPYLKEIESTKYPMLIAGIYNLISKAYYDIGHFSSSENFALLAIEQHRGISVEQAKDSYELLYKIYKLQNNSEKALEFHEKFADAKQAYLDEVSAKSLAFELAQHKSAKQQADIQLLNKRNELLNKENDLLNVEHKLSQSEVENTRLIATLLLAIVTLLAFFGYRSWRTQKRLKILAEYDSLTGIYNRGHFMQLAYSLTGYSKKANQTLCCMLFDLDKFKAINDSYGHQTGDWVLKQAVLAIKHVIREQDVFARLGGEEFCLLLPSCELQAATYVAEKCLKQLQEIDTSVTGHDIKITASVGITNSKLSGFNISKLIADADNAMYAAKSAGRNQLIIYSGD